MDQRLIPAGGPPPAKTEPGFWFIFAAQKLLVTEDGGSPAVPLIVDPASVGLRPLRERYLGRLAGRPCWCSEIADSDPLPPKTGLYGLRYLYGSLPAALFAVAMKAVHLTEWEGTARYCGRCGKETVPGNDMNSRECPACGLTAFPRISPAVIVLVEKEGRLLLARGERFTEPFYSVLAGFVEPGETLEDAVHREIEEEVGIKVKNVRYFASQPWPFPDSLMIGFTAEYASGEIKIDRTEIVDAGWFDPAHLPTIPGKVSIARRLIDWFVETRSKDKTTAGPFTERRYDPGE